MDLQALAPKLPGYHQHAAGELKTTPDGLKWMIYSPRYWNVPAAQHMYDYQLRILDEE